MHLGQERPKFILPHHSRGMVTESRYSLLCIDFTNGIIATGIIP